VEAAGPKPRSTISLWPGPSEVALRGQPLNVGHVVIQARIAPSIGTLVEALDEALIESAPSARSTPS